MSYRLPLRASSIALVAGFTILAVAACGDSGGSIFDAPDSGTSGTSNGVNTSTSGFFNPDSGTSGTSGNGDDDDGTGDGGCVNDVCIITPTTVCGDGKVEAPEECDDGNPQPGDGCSGTCKVEPGWTCPPTGGDCAPPKTVCGNGKKEVTEGCDDGQNPPLDGDGCSAGCQVEEGFACIDQGKPCIKVDTAECGDKKVDHNEGCDDGNKLPGDGCDATCQTEAGYECPTAGVLCKKFEYCGDSVVQTSSLGETCDDGNRRPGDGCDGNCHLEAGYECKTPGAKCTSIWICGNGIKDPGEACDDGALNTGDGCSETCGVEPGWTCPNNKCVQVVENVCGNAIVAGKEQCDDANKDKGDGCDENCLVEAGYTCPTAGKLCKKIPKCGDGKMDSDIGETCDDGQNPPKDGDGCNSNCRIEPNYVCNGTVCTSTVVCGDGKIQGKETCDDGNKIGSDGCSAVTCLLETGWRCPIPGVACISICGDGKVVGKEQCDDGAASVDPVTKLPIPKSGDGCDATCLLETTTTTSNDPPSTTTGYFVCEYKPANAPQQTCRLTTCGDGVKEGAEQCDNDKKGKDVFGVDYPTSKAYDLCSPTCQLEPNCPNGTCIAVCGDSLLTNYDTNGDGKPDEDCDDGNTQDGDGCSKDCKIEKGYSCTNSAGTFPTYLDIPIVVRDFRFNGKAADGLFPAGHPDFESFSCSSISTGLVKDQLSAGLRGVPVFNGTNSDRVNGTGCDGQLTDAAQFDEWYKDGSRAYRIDGLQLRLQRTGAAGNYSYVFDSANDEPWKTKQGFFPIDGKGWGNEGSGDGGEHNFAFTSELRYWFTYDKNTSPNLAFSGDDDVWVFINGKLALDVGGLHGRQDADFTLDNAKANNLGLVDGRLYEIALFHAERHTGQSNFKLTLRGFVKNTSLCSNICGDGFQTREEQCDLGTPPLVAAGKNKSPAPYGGCSTTCLLGAYCGDKTVTNPPETCDDGSNLVDYGGQSKVCGQGCKYAPYCGDAELNGTEVCDEGTAKNLGEYGKCNPNCSFAPRCGDSITDATKEDCDHGVSNGATGDSCDATCHFACGNGKPDVGEECDLGAGNNKGTYDGCTATCSKAAFCGDGIKNGNEECDDGKNDGTYGTCNTDCTIAPFCGDGVKSLQEGCDKGDQNSLTAYGKDQCTNRCTPAPFCGDHVLQAGKEVCDDGVNSGLAGSCKPDCSAYIPNLACGNGTVDAAAGEQCDHGNKNGTAGDSCDSHCKNACGNGIVDSANGETCDNGVNDGSYGGCTTDCKAAGYCGDGVKNGPEQCDNSSSNQPIESAYGKTICTQACTQAPYCGDGRVQSKFGEQCDLSASCDAVCKTTGPK